MKSLTYILVAGVAFWSGVATTIQPPAIVRIVKAERANYTVPVQECANVCRGKARSDSTKERK